MLEAFGWGFLAASSLILGGAVALLWPVGPRLLGIVMAFGSGVLISAVAFELVEEAWATRTAATAASRLGLFAGSLVFYVGDTLIDRAGGDHRKHSGGKQADGAPLAIVLGTMLDGIPESIVLGLTLVGTGSVSVAYLVAVFISNVPEAFSSSAGLATGGVGERPRDRALGGRRHRVRPLVAVRLRRCSTRRRRARTRSCSRSPRARILTMLADTMMPEAYEHGGKLVGVVTTFGFAVAFGLSSWT